MSDGTRERERGGYLGNGPVVLQQERKLSEDDIRLKHVRGKRWKSISWKDIDNDSLIYSKPKPRERKNK